MRVFRVSSPEDAIGLQLSLICRGQETLMVMRVLCMSGLQCKGTIYLALVQSILASCNANGGNGITLPR